MDLPIPDPRVPVLASAIQDLVAGYAEMRRVLIDHYEAPDDVQQELLGPLYAAADRATQVLTAGV
ncbi:MAG: hypothetical protein QOI64_1627 [Solirubrobacteraceae bacterium]|jgi:hypothetical protein|nr:hypothetical protein [Solirubrobacteraceae bacterium]